jgi:hypothetical protein
MVKELLFSIYINKLTEPKPIKISKAKSIVNKKNERENNTEITEAIISTIKEKKRIKKSLIDTPEGVLMADIKIVKNTKTGKIVSDAYILEGGFIIWKYHNDSCSNKEKEIINIISEVIEYNNEKVYKISINNKPFIKDYYEAMLYYKEIIKDPNMDTFEKIFQTQSIGQLKVVNKIRMFSQIIIKHNSFSCVQ